MIMIGNMIQSMLCDLAAVFDRNVGLVQADDAWFSNDEEELCTFASEYLGLTLSEDALPIRREGYTLLPMENGNAVVIVEGEDELAQKYAATLAVSLGSFRHLYNEKFDRSNLLKNILTDSILPNELLARTADVNFSFDRTGVVMIIRGYSMNGYSPIEVLRPLFSEQDSDYLIPMDEHSIALIKALPDDYTQKTTEEIAQQIIAAVGSDAYAGVTVGIGSKVDSIRTLSKSYKDANMALEVGQVFDSEKPIIHYENLGIGRLIYQLPTTLCELFLSEIFQKESLDALDRETLHTIDQFFENNLNISEASRQLYVHRNTLVYRLDKVQKLTGLDLRVFDDAIVFKIALMVKKYLDANPMRL